MPILAFAIHMIIMTIILNIEFFIFIVPALIFDNINEGFKINFSDFNKNIKYFGYIIIIISLFLFSFMSHTVINYVFVFDDQKEFLSKSEPL